MFHIGHLNIIKRCVKYANGGKVIVGVSSDKFNYKKKSSYPMICEEQRLEIVKNIKGVHDVFLEKSIKKKLKYCLKYNADSHIMGDDHIGRFDYLTEHGIDVIYFPRTEGISTTILKSSI